MFTEMLLSHRRSQVGFNEFEPSCADLEGRTDATSLGYSEVGGTGAHGSNYIVVFGGALFSSALRY